MILFINWFCFWLYMIFFQNKLHETIWHPETSNLIESITLPNYFKSYNGIRLDEPQLIQHNIDLDYDDCKKKYKELFRDY